MNVLKNMEVIFIASAVILCATSYASAAVRATPAIDAGSVKMAVVDGVKMPVVTISAKRPR
ncbi:hypothetical protein [Duganella aceris]|uniref:Uncharacterized protein n=1 Tax=Duganella aceris TaxID=2703883 RepID=A0ABX0FN87_9BURK|nr:hypothetical protein [Duganella aceris]NGZ86061.1 hypothetical protein [Duganella aceris]